MRTVRLADLEDRLGPADVSRPLTDALGLADAAINYYELAPGESFAYGLHAHADQEEIFYVQAGTVTFRTRDGPVEVTAGELARIGPGEYQRGVNEGDERVEALAIGAPQETGGTDVRRDCPDCGEVTAQSIELTDELEAAVTRCAVCDAVTGRFE